MSAPTPTRACARLARADRRAGRALRRSTGAHPAIHGALAAAARTLSPAFRLTTAALIAHPRTRATGVRTLAAATAAATLARLLRDAIGRSRPGARTDGGFPSRHAAAAVAIAATVSAERPRLGVCLAGAAMVGVVGRVATGDHDPADIAAGAVLGAAVAAVVTRAAPGR